MYSIKGYIFLLHGLGNYVVSIIYGINFNINFNVQAFLIRWWQIYGQTKNEQQRNSLRVPLIPLVARNVKKINIGCKISVKILSSLGTKDLCLNSQIQILCINKTTQPAMQKVLNLISQCTIIFYSSNKRGKINCHLFCVCYRILLSCTPAHACLQLL